MFCRTCGHPRELHDAVGCTWKSFPPAVAGEPELCACTTGADETDRMHDHDPRTLGPTTLVAARDATKEEQPNNARRFAILAAEFGWAVRVTYAEALPVPTPQHPDPGVTRTVAVRISRARFGLPTERLVGLWRNGRYDFGGSEWVRLGYRDLLRRLA